LHVRGEPDDEVGESWDQIVPHGAGA
jgi:hypothetical protein